MLCLGSCFATVFAQAPVLSQITELFHRAPQLEIQRLAEGNQWQVIRTADTLRGKLIEYNYSSGVSGITGKSTFIYTDSNLLFASVDILNHPDHKTAQSQLIRSGFKLVNNGIDGDFITSIYSSPLLTVIEGYMALEHPSGKGHVPLFRYSLFRKYSEFDKANGLKKEYEVRGKDSILVAASIRENGVLNGDRILYYPNGNVQRKENWKNGHLYGTASEYTTSGQLCHSVQYAYDWKIGQEKWYDATGKVVAAQSWNKDIRTGTFWKKYDGKEVTTITYVKGIPEGQTIIAIYPDQTVDSMNTKPVNIEAVTFVNGLKQSIAFGLTLDRADTLYRCYYKNDFRDSIMERFEHGILAERSWWLNGQMEGEALNFITSGELTGQCYRKAQFQNGKLHGREEQFFMQQAQSPNATWVPMTYVVNYINGQKHGPFEIVKPSEQLRERGTYKIGVLDDYYEYSKKEGEDVAFEKGWYRNGVMDSVWIKGTESGSRYAEEFYRNGKKAGEWSVYQYDKLLRAWTYNDSDYVSTLITHFTDGTVIRYSIDSLGIELKKIKAAFSDQTRNHYYEFLAPLDLKTNPEALLEAFHFSTREELANAAQGMHVETVGDTVRRFQKNEAGKWWQVYEYNTKTALFQLNEPESMSWNPVFFEESGKPFTGEIKSAKGAEIIHVKAGVRHGWTKTTNATTGKTQRIYFNSGKQLFHLPFKA